jgi:PAS domain-containing protein
LNEDDQKQEQEADDEREGRALAHSLPAKPAPYVSLLGKGSWANLLTLLEVSPDALVLVDSAGRIARVNSQTEALFAYPRSELEGEALEALLPMCFTVSSMPPLHAPALWAQDLSCMGGAKMAASFRWTSA